MQKLAFIGGSSAGIGKAIAETLLEKDFNVIITARGEERLHRTAEEFHKRFPKKNITPIVSDSSSEKSMSDLISKIRASSSDLDVLVLNTGGPKIAKFFDLSSEDWEISHQQLVKSQLTLIKEFLPAMMKKNWGRIINISSTVTLEPTSAMVLSAGYRALLINVLKGLTWEASKSNITINTVCPSAVRSDRLVESIKKNNQDPNFDLEKEIQRVGKDLPMGRIADPRELASLVAYLVSNDAAYITGTVIPVDGGVTRKGI